MAQFHIKPIERFAGSSAAIRRPKVNNPVFQTVTYQALLHGLTKEEQEIACFSYDDEHIFHLDQRSLRYYYPPLIGADLSKGFETFQQLDDSTDDHLDSLLTTIADLEEKTGTKCETDFVTWRGMMTKIMTTPFDNMAGFEMNATRFQDTIFIEENHEYKLESKRQQFNQPTRPGAQSQDLMSYWGYKFETLSLIPDTWDSTPREFIEGREDMIVNNHAQYCSVVKTGIGKAKMVLGGEVDAVWDCKPADTDKVINWVELKTSAEITDDREAMKYERKLLKFWVQSFLLGVPKIIVGFRSKAGVLQRIEELDTNGIPGMVKRKGKGTWDGNLCINFTASFMDWLKRTVTSEGVWRIRRKEKHPIIEVFKVEESGYGDILSPEFLNWRTRSQDQNGAESKSRESAESGA